MQSALELETWPSPVLGSPHREIHKKTAKIGVLGVSARFYEKGKTIRWHLTIDKRVLKNVTTMQLRASVCEHELTYVTW